MHIPDGWLSLPIILLGWSITLGALGFAVVKFKKENIENLTNVGVVAAVIFVAQMFNFPIAGGTSGHMLGAAFATYVLGVPGAIMAMFVVITTQAIVFADGGIVTIGVNVFNMGIVGVIVAYIVRRIFEGLERNAKNKETKDRIYVGGAFLAAFLSVVFASFFACSELVASGVTTYKVSLPPILFYHTLIGLGEGFLTMFIILFLMKSEFPLRRSMEQPAEPFIETIKKSNKPLLGSAIILFGLSVLALFASPHPDGLEKVSMIAGFENKAREPFGLGVANDYDFLMLGGFLGTFLSALLGIVIVLGVFFIPAMIVREYSAKKTQFTQ